MNATDNEEPVRRMIEEGFNENDLDLADELVAEDFVLHAAARDEPIRGPDGLKEFLGTYRSAFPDGHIEIDELVAEGDTVVARWTATGTHDGDLMGIEPTGNEVRVMGMEMHHVRDGKLAEGWEIFDGLGMMAQLGVVSPPGGTTPEA